MRPPLFIVNPACGARDSARDLPRILSAAEQILGDVHIRYTARRGHARELALQGAREGYPLIVAVGGDGTFSEVAGGVLEAGDGLAAGDAGGDGLAASAAARAAAAADNPADDSAVGLVNVGTGGDFRRSLGIEPGYERCLEALALGRERFVDVGRVSFVGTAGEHVEQYFVNVLSAGLGGLVDRYMDSMPRFIGGRAAYYLASLRAVAVSRERPLLARVTWEGETREELIPVYVLAICNGRWFGGGMDVAPMALVDDGRLEVVAITEHTKRALARKVRLVYTGRHLDEPTVRHFPCERIELRLDDKIAERRVLLDVDGDALGSLPVTIELVPRRLRVRA